MAKTGNIKLVIVLHALSNLFGSILLQLLMRISEVAAGMYILLIMFLGIMGLLVFLVNKKKMIIDGEAALLKWEVVKELLGNKGIMFYIAVTLIFIYLHTIV